MAYDQELAARIRAAIGDERGVTEKEMFGGIAFLREGKMFVGVVKDDLMVRVGAEAYEDALSRPAARPMDFNPRMQAVGFVFVGPKGVGGKALAAWVKQGYEFVGTLPAKKKPKAKPKAKARRG